MSLPSFLEDHRTSVKDKQTHTWFAAGNKGNVTCKLHIAEAEVEQLYDWLVEYVQGKDEKNLASGVNALSEKIVTPNFRFFLDVDFGVEQIKVYMDKLGGSQRDKISSLKSELAKLIKGFKVVVEHSSGIHDLSMLVASRLPYKLHIYFPDLVVSKEDAKLLCSVITNNFKSSDFYSANVIDGKVYGTGLRTLFCHKGTMTLKDISKFEKEKALHEEVFGKKTYHQVYKLIDLETWKKKHTITKEDLLLTTLKPEEGQMVTKLQVKLQRGTKALKITKRVNGQIITEVEKAEQVDDKIQEVKGEDNLYDRDVSKAAKEFFNNFYGLQEEFETYMIREQEKSIVFPTTQKMCPIKKGRHSQNNGYISISEFGWRFKCHDEECKRLPVQNFKDLPQTLQNLYLNHFKMEDNEKKVKKLVAKTIKGMKDDFPKEMNLTVKTNDVQQMGFGYLAKIKENRYCPLCKSFHDEPENSVFINPLGCFASCKRVPDKTHPIGISGIPLPPNVMNNLFYIDQRTFVVNNNSSQSNDVNLLRDDFKDGMVFYEDEKLNTLFKQSFVGTNARFARYFHQLKSDVFVSTVDRQSSWFYFKDHKWEQDPNGSSLMLYLSSDDNLEPYNRALEAYSNLEDKRSRTIEQSISQLIKSFQNTATQKGFVDQCALFFKDKNSTLVKSLDQNRYLIGFDNGVYDLTERRFRSGKPSDYISLSVGYQYISEVTNVQKEEVMDFIRKILTDPGVLHYIMKLLGSCVSGDTRDEKLHVFIGGGANGKSTLLLLLSHALGMYAASLKSTILTEKSPSSDAATPGMTKAVGKRVVVLQETNSGEKINEARLKASLGADKIDYRPLFKEASEFYPHFKMILSTNNPLTIQGTDHGIWRKIRMVNFESKFVDETLLQDNDGDHVYKADKSIMSKIAGDWKHIFIHILIDYYYIWLQEGLGEVPEKIARYNEDYKDSQDLAGTFIKEQCDTKGSKKCRTHATPLWEAFNRWQNGLPHKLSKDAFYKSLKNRGMVFKKGMKIEGIVNTGWEGIRLSAVLAEDDDSEDDTVKK